MGDFVVGWLELLFGFGFKCESIEIGGIEVLNYGKCVDVVVLLKMCFIYVGCELDVVWWVGVLVWIE